MPHYVNIALGGLFFDHAFCLQGRGGSLTDERSGAMWRMCEGTKSMTKISRQGTARGAAPKNAGSMEDFWDLRGITVCRLRIVYSLLPS
jgi:hypothetical protein